MKHHISTVTQEGMTVSQPGTSVSMITGTGIDGVVLHLSRYYNDQPNEFGGKGAFRHCDYDNLQFATREEANAFALEHGYTQHWFRRSYPDRAWKCAAETAKKGYNGKRKLTRYLIDHLPVNIKYGMGWNG